MYEGNWTKSECDGSGKKQFADRTIYEGEFKNDKAHGQGIKKLSNGVVYKGTWVDGTFVKGE